MVKFKDFSMPLSVFQVLFKANFIFRTFQDSPVYSSTFQACTNPVDYEMQQAPKSSHLILFIGVQWNCWPYGWQITE